MNNACTSVGKVLLIAATLLVAACDRRDDPNDTPTDTPAARGDAGDATQDPTRPANASVDEAQAERDLANDDGLSDRTETVADAQRTAIDAGAIDLQKAESDRQMARQRCDSLPAADRNACIDAADTAYETARVAAQRAQDAADVRTPATPPTP